jgi:hypothetical protein
VQGAEHAYFKATANILWEEMGKVTETSVRMVRLSDATQIGRLFITSQIAL